MNNINKNNDINTDALNEYEFAEIADENWQLYKSNNLKWFEIIKGSGLVYGNKDSSLKSVLRLIKLAGNDAIRNVLILGEPGTGKELIAKAIHKTSPRKDKPFIKVNCAAIQPNLIESEFFGHKRGAFTGAVTKREGRFKIADGGTIFLDEIGELPIHLQAKLLRVLQENEFELVGSSQTIKINVKVIAATNANIDKMRNEGKFRNDLYYRLCGLRVELEPLRERWQDIPALVRYFAEKCGVSRDGNEGQYDEELFKSMLCYAWPGNIRELEAFITLTQALEAETISLANIASIPTHPSYYELKIAFKKYAENCEREKLILKLTDIAGNMFLETWKLLENAWEKWQERRKISLSNLKLEKKIFYQELDNKDRERLEEIIQDALKQFRLFLESEGYSEIPNSNCYSMLMSYYRSNQKVDDIGKAAKQTLLDVLSKLKERELALSNQLEREHYDRFRIFFGKTHRGIRAWGKNKFWTKQISTLSKPLVSSFLFLLPAFGALDTSFNSPWISCLIPA